MGQKSDAKGLGEHPSKAREVILEGESAAGAGFRRALLFAIVFSVAVGVVEITADQARRYELISQLTRDFTQYAAASFFGLILIWTAVHVVGLRLVCNILITGLLFLVLGGLLNLTADSPTLREWPLLGGESPLNAPAKYACELMSIILAFVAFVTAILALRTTRDDLLREREKLMEEISEREKAKEALKESESMYRMLVESTNSFVFSLDTGGVCRYVNRFWTDRLGYSSDEIVGTNGFHLITPESLKGFREEFAIALGGESRSDIEFRSKTSDGGFVDVSVNLNPILDSSGQVTLMLGTGIDITERKRAEEDRERLEEQYRQAQKMEAVGQLTGGVAHDFNNLLQVINGGTEMAISDLPEGHLVRESLATVAKAGERAARLVSQLLLFSRRQIMQPESLDLNDIVGNLLKLLGRLIGEFIQLQFHPGKHAGAIHADRGMVEQAVMNLCLNARDAMPTGGTLTIETSSVVIDEAYCAAHSWATPGRFALLSISDSGHGMDPGTVEHIFEPFFTTKEVGKGTGLGLATVYGIVKQHEGMIHAYSEPGKGSTFKLYWPKSAAPTETPQEEPEELVSGGTETILLAEDDDMVRDLAERVLKRAGYMVLTAQDGTEAVALFEKRATEIAMVILDVVMPKMGGREAYEHMQRLRPGLKALFASGYSENAIHTNFVLDEDLALVQKPFSPNALLLAVRKILDSPQV